MLEANRVACGCSTRNGGQAQISAIEIDYWWGWVDLSHDRMPRIFRPAPKETVYYAMGYGGNGVMYSAQAGRRAAQMIAGKGQDLDLPIFTSPLPGFGFLTPAPTPGSARDVSLVPSRGRIALTDRPATHRPAVRQRLPAPVQAALAVLMRSAMTPVSSSAR